MWLSLLWCPSHFHFVWCQLTHTYNYVNAHRGKWGRKGGRERREGRGRGEPKSTERTQGAFWRKWHQQSLWKYWQLISQAVAINTCRDGAPTVLRAIAHLKYSPCNLWVIFNTSVTINLNVLLSLLSIPLMCCPALHNPKQITFRKLNTI